MATKGNENTEPQILSDVDQISENLPTFNSRYDGERIDAAVGKAHSHGNMITLEKFGESDDQPTFNGQPIEGKPGENGEPGEDGKDATINGMNVLEIVGGKNIDVTVKDKKAVISSTAPGTSVDIMFFVVDDDGLPVASHHTPTDPQIILDQTHIRAIAEVWHDVITFTLSQDLKGTELEFIPENFFTAKFWIRSDMARIGAQFRLSATNIQDGTLLATGTTSFDLGNTGVPTPVIINGKYERAAVVPAENVRMTLQVLTPLSDVQIGIVSIPPFETSYLSRLISGPSGQGEPGPPGPQGEPGTDGRTPELLAQGTDLLTRYKGDEPWSKLFAIPQPSFVFSPQNWPENTEVDLGDGTYGIRAVGTITVAANTAHTVEILPGINNVKILSVGGIFFRTSSNSLALPVAAYIGTDLSNYAFVRTWIDDTVELVTLSNSNRTNAPYDVWIRYTKTTVGGIPVPPPAYSPHLWPENTEIDFGDGSFGYRTTGKITELTGVQSNLTIMPVYDVNNDEWFKKIFSFGGFWHMGTFELPVGSITSPSNPTIWSTVFSSGNSIQFRSLSNTNRTDAPYDVWIRYIKRYEP